ncbi:MAG TPA: sugar phosphate isomerase/epimerase [Fimbriimonadaceae bacterium]|nr:sugar phosphate isomerase/epimerase [Fimbriimonadaceae bacterium]
MTRRDFLRTSSITAVGAVPVLRALAHEANPYAPFKMGIQSYSLRGFKLDQALAVTKELGLGYWEGWEGHVPMSENLADRSENRLKLKNAGVKMTTFGVVGFNADAARSRKIFEFGRAMGVEVLSADPTPEAFDELEKLTEEFDIRIAIHNHGPRSRYDKISSVVDAVKNRSKRIGASVDTGHYLRSSESPVEALKRLEGRVFSVHLKDVKDATQFKILGQGDLDVVGCLKTLKAQGYGYTLALEYEENPQNPTPDLVECLRVVRDGLRQI